MGEDCLPAFCASAGRNMNRWGEGLLGLSFPYSAQPKPDPLRPVAAPSAEGHRRKHLSTTGRVRFLWGCGELAVLPGLGAIGYLFRDHPEACWPSASQAPGNSVSVPGVS